MLARADAHISKLFYDSLKYTYRDEEGDFIHPNQFFVFNREMKWKATVVGTDFTAKDLEKALDIARDDMNIVSKMILFPETLAVTAGILFFLVSIFAVLWSARRKAN